nr:MAG TPA: hypothetical protein [Caudoviricetes sp.]DAZ83384.1 MAG TPA: hypothetical protein [Caudoviricetes sp.]
MKLVINTNWNLFNNKTPSFCYLDFIISKCQGEVNT